MNYELFDNPDVITEIIDTINNNFEEIYLQNIINNLINANIKNIDYATIRQNYSHSASSYYLNGHCNSYANILCNIFKENATKYNSDDHVIVKIGEHFYDTTGLIDYRVGSQYHIADLYYIDIMLTNNDSTEATIEKKLTKIGTEELEYQLEKNKKNKIIKKTK